MNPNEQLPEQPRQDDQAPDKPAFKPSESTQSTVDQPFTQQPLQPIEQAAPASSFTQTSPTTAPVITTNDTDATQPVNQDHEQNQPAGHVTTDIALAEYTSNPFRSFMKGLSSLTHYNPVSTLTLGFLTIGITALFAILVFVVGSLLSTISPVLGFFAGAAIVVGVYILLLRAYAAGTIILLQKTEITAVKAYVKMNNGQFFKFLGAIILTALVSGAAALLFVIPGLIVFSRLSLVPFVIFNENTGVTGAMRRSWSLTKGHTWEMLAANIVPGITLGNGGMLLVVGTQSGIANRYKELAAAEKSSQSTGPTHWMNYAVTIVALVVIVGYFGAIAAVSYNANKQFESLREINSSQQDFNTFDADQFNSSPIFNEQEGPIINNSL